MRLLPIALVLLAARSAHAQDVGEIDVAVKGGFAQGHSTYGSPDGGRREVPWLNGRKHGAYRHVGPNGVVLEEGQYLHGQRIGEWIQRDKAGNRIGVGHWVLGVLNGLQQRYEYTDGKATLVESIIYVLGMRHGFALYRDEESGQLVRGSFAWDVRHGTFEAAARAHGPEITYVCGWWNTEGEAALKRIRDPAACRYRSAIELHAPEPAQWAISNPKRYAKSVAKTICDAGKTLGVPVVLGGSLLICPKQSAAKHGQMPKLVKIGNKVYSSEDLIRMLDASGLTYTYATFKYTVGPNKLHIPWLQGKGYVEFTGAGPAYWKGHDCEVRVDRDAGTIEAASTQLGKSATQTFTDSPLRVAHEFLESQGRLLTAYRPEIVESNNSTAVVELAPRLNSLTTQKIRVTIAYKDFVQNEATLTLPDGGELHLDFAPPRVTRMHLSGTKGYIERRAKVFYEKWPGLSPVSAEELQCAGWPW